MNKYIFTVTDTKNLQVCKFKKKIVLFASFSRFLFVKVEISIWSVTIYIRCIFAENRFDNNSNNASECDISAKKLLK